MARTRLSARIDANPREPARTPRAAANDAARAVEVNASYAAYDEHPLDEPDEWGDLASFRRAAAAS